MTLSEEEKDVTVVRARLADFPELDRFRAVLAPDEALRAAAHKLDEPRDIFVLARGLLRFELARRTGSTAQDLRFDLRPSGKPDLRRGPSHRGDWRFSVSHTGPFVAIALSDGIDVGVDIEPSNRNVNPLEIATRYFAEAEIEALKALPEAQRRRAFFAGWTRKEAIVKARGSTMSESLTTLAVSLDPANMHPDSRDDDTPPGTSARAACRLTSFELPEQNLIGAVALVGDSRPCLTFEVRSGKSFD